MASFYHYAPEFTSIDHLAPQLAVEQPYIQRPDGSYIQLEYRAGDVIPWAVTRYCLPAASVNGAIVCGSGAVSFDQWLVARNHKITHSGRDSYYWSSENSRILWPGTRSRKNVLYKQYEFETKGGDQ